MWLEFSHDEGPKNTHVVGWNENLRIDNGRMVHRRSTRSERSARGVENLPPNSVEENKMSVAQPNHHCTAGAANTLKIPLIVVVGTT
jgi:hypothetical protein